MAFVNFLDPFPHYQVDDRDDLPVATLEGVTTDGYPVEATMAEFMRWWTRVRRWRMTGTMALSWTQTYEADWTDPDPPNNTSNGPWTASAAHTANVDTITDGQYAQGEEDHLVCSAILAGAASESGAATVSDTYPDRAPSYASTFSWSLFFGLEATPPRWRESEDGDRYFPRMTFSGSVTVGGIQATWSSIFEEETAGNHYTYGELTFAGKTIAIQLRWNDYFGEVTQTWTVDLTISPYEWYEMDPGDGLGPVYESATGDRTVRALPNH